MYVAVTVVLRTNGTYSTSTESYVHDEPGTLEEARGTTLYRRGGREVPSLCEEEGGKREAPPDDEESDGTSPPDEERQRSASADEEKPSEEGRASR